MRSLAAVLAISLIASLQGGASAKDKPDPKFSAKKHEAAVRSRLRSFLRGRSITRFTRKVEDEQDRDKEKHELRDSKVRTHWRKYVPGAYRKHWKRKAFWPAPIEGEKAFVLDKPKVLRLYVHRDTVLTIYEATPVEIRWGQLDYGSRSTYWDVWVKQGGKWVMAREKKGQNPTQQDRAAVSGQQLLQHPWFEKSVSMNEVAVRVAETRGGNELESGRETELQRKVRAKTLKKDLANLLRKKFVADVGSITGVDESDGQVILTIACGTLDVGLMLSKRESEERAEFFAGLKKRSRVVFRCGFDYTYRGLEARYIDDKKPTVVAWKPED